MAKSSIHFNAVKPTSEVHNYRLQELSYLLSERKGDFENWSISTIDDQLKTITKLCKKLSGRKLQKNAEPIKEAVVNLNPQHTMDDLKLLANVIQESFGIHCFQIHIHRDEGHIDKKNGEIIINHHAHLLFDWQDKSKGTMRRLKSHDLSKMQTVVANALQMERGELRTNSNRERLEAIEYKAKKAEEQYYLVKTEAFSIVRDLNLLRQKKVTLQEEVSSLEQKKNQVNTRIDAIRKGIYAGADDDEGKIRIQFTSSSNGSHHWKEDDQFLSQLTPDQLKIAISILGKDIQILKQKISRIKF